jgi:hypothetical protein
MGTVIIVPPHQIGVVTCVMKFVRNLMKCLATAGHLLNANGWLPTVGELRYAHTQTIMPEKVITNFSKRHDVIPDCKQLECTSFGWLSTSHMKTSDLARSVTSGYIWDAQSMMRNGDVTVTPHRFKPLSRWYRRVQVVKNYASPFVTNDITCIWNSINFHPADL